LTERLAGCFADQRDQCRVEHSVLEMLRQRVYGLALGDEDLNDHEQLKKDPMLRLLSGKKDQQEDLAGKDLAQAQPQTLRLKLLKIAATKRVTARKIWAPLPRSYPLPSVFR
jgi:hypothetical protein